MARRSLTGMGRICGIYTLGTEDPYAERRGHRGPGGDFPVLTASIGEDFADCRWPVTIKAQAAVTADKLVWYLQRLTDAVKEGFFMDPNIGPAIYWRWTGTVLPGISGPDAPAPRRSVEQTIGTGDRSFPGHGPRCGIYLVDDAENWAGDHFYGKIQGNTAISGSVDEDYAASRWPIVAKIHACVNREKFVQYLCDLAVCVEDGFYFEVTELLNQ
ncbi:MAG: hypothetical protein ACE5HT_12840 [Gemmatimonadales bacterium]